MTNKPMLSVERNPLGLSSEAYSVMLGMVEHCLNIRACMGMDEGFKDFDTEEEHAFVVELRALLDKPAGESEVDRLERRCKNAELALKVQTENFEALKAAQHQGEPVAIVDESDDGLFIELIYGENGSPLKRGDKLYAEQPAPVAVVISEVRSLLATTNYSASRDCHNAQVIGAACDLIDRLNGVKP